MQDPGFTEPENLSETEWWRRGLCREADLISDLEILDPGAVTGQRRKLDKFHSFSQPLVSDLCHRIGVAPSWGCQEA